MSHRTPVQSSSYNTKLSECSASHTCHTVPSSDFASGKSDARGHYRWRLTVAPKGILDKVDGAGKSELEMQTVGFASKEFAYQDVAHLILGPMS